MEKDYQQMTDENIREVVEFSNAVTKYAKFLYHERDMNLERTISVVKESCHHALMASVLGVKKKKN